MAMTCLFVAPRAMNELHALHQRSVVLAQIDHRIGERVLNPQWTGLGAAQAMFLTNHSYPDQLACSKSIRRRGHNHARRRCVFLVWRDDMPRSSDV